MKKQLLTILAGISLALTAFAGETANHSMEVNDSPFYSNHEMNIDAFGSYSFTKHNHAYGGGMDAKYFFNRNFALGVEAFGLDKKHTDKGAALATFTARYPISATRFAPYAFVGGGSTFTSNHHNLVGQGGVGLETRISPNVGVLTDISFLKEKHSKDSGMVRAGLNFAF